MIPVCEPLLGPEERTAVLAALDSGRIADGPCIPEFERRFAAYCGVAHGVAVSSGTAALAVALQALELEPGSEVILPSLTIISCALAVIEAGCVPVLADCAPDTGCLDPAQVAARITPRTRAVIPVHLFGHPADMDALADLARRHGLALVEDAAQAHGATHGGRRVGGLGTLGCFSFYANKIITTGEGGMVVTDDARLAERLRLLRNLAFRPDRRFRHTEIGHNYRMTNLQAALGCAQLDRIDEILARKRRLAQAYAQGLDGIAGITRMAERPGVQSACWMAAVVIDEAVGFDASVLAERLRAGGVDSRPFFLGLHEQPVLRQRGLFADTRLPVTERLARQGLYLPTGPTLDLAEVERVCQAVREALA